MSEGLAKGPYVAARVGFEPVTFWMQGTEPTTEPPHLTMNGLVFKFTLSEFLKCTLKMPCCALEKYHIVLWPKLLCNVSQKSSVNSSELIEINMI